MPHLCGFPEIRPGFRSPVRYGEEPRKSFIYKGFGVLLRKRKCPWQGLMRAGVSGKDRVLVNGPGPVGQAVVMLAGGLGASVIGVDISQERMEMARKVGAEQVFDRNDLQQTEAERKNLPISGEAFYGK